MAGERRLDLAELDAEAADLHLVVDAAEELEGAVRQPAREVARAVEPRAGPCREAGERIGHEALGGQVRPPEVAARQPVAAEEQLARHAGRDRPQVAVEQMGVDVRERPAERRAARPGTERRSIGPAMAPTVVSVGP